MAYKKDKMSVSILKHVSDILQFEVKSPDIGFVTVTSVEVTKDLSSAKIYVRYIDKQNREIHLQALERVKGYIRSSLAKKLTIYKVPELVFIYDDSIEKGEKIEHILAEINKDKVK